ncbi:MAG TPA: DUF1028 domain-containing protein [bacterium]|nr:DUF1028 domain-containing protein [bacterium]
MLTPIPPGARRLLLIAVALCASNAAAVERPVATYSIVARDSATGQLGVAVQSHWFSVGPIVPWAEAGVGAIATQSLVKIDYGPEGLERLKAGQSPQAALEAMLAADSGRAVRQVAIVDAQGRVAAHTGSKCIAHAGHITGEAFSVQANLMEDSTVPRAMAQAYHENSSRPFAERLLAALVAAEGEKGDIRGRQSAAMLIVDGQTHEKPWQGKVLELRIEDHPAPLEELARILRIANAYDFMNRGDLFAEKQMWDSAAWAYGSAEQIAPEIVELPFWHAVTLASAGRVDDALPIFRRVFAAEPQRWLPLIDRLVPSGLLPNDPALVARIKSVAP